MVQGIDPRNGCISAGNPFPLSSDTVLDGLVSELVLLNTELKGDVLESEDSCPMDVEHKSTNAHYFVNCVNPDFLAFRRPRQLRTCTT